MGIENTPYGSDRYAMSQEIGLGKLAASANNAADEVIGRHRFFTNVKLLEVRAVIQVIGTNTDSGFNVYNGTTSIGSIVIGTSAAGTVVDATLTDTEFDTDEDLSVKVIGATDTGAAFVSLQYQERYC